MATWILSLAMLAVGARNFEDGLSVDAPIYATIARNIARTGRWIFLDAQTPERAPFAEHPHLGLWVQGLIFKILPISDSSARLQGHLYFLLFLFIFYRLGSYFFSSFVATIATILLLIFPVFSNFFSTFYLDPGCLCLGLLFLICYARALGLSYSRFENRWSQDQLSWSWALFAGLFLGLAFMQKGLMALGFGPTAAVLGLLALSLSKNKAKNLAASALTLGATTLVLAAYHHVVVTSELPEFFQIYWAKQITQRYGHQWSLTHLFAGGFWSKLMRDTHGLLLAVPFAIYFARASRRALAVVLIFGLSFVLMYAPSLAVGGQYWMPILPVVALVLAAGFCRDGSSQKWMRFSRSFAIVAVLVLQYFPIRTHFSRMPSQTDFLRELKRERGFDRLVLIGQNFDFTLAAAFTWYADYRVESLSSKSYLESLASEPSDKAAVYYLIDDELSKNWALPRGYCRNDHVAHLCKN